MPRQTKYPSLAQDLLMLSDVYRTLGRLAFQRWRRGTLWPQDPVTRTPTARVLTLLRPEEDEGQADSEPGKRG